MPNRFLAALPTQPGGSVQSYETTPILDGKLITETAETAYKAHHQPRVPLMLGSNSADTAGNRDKSDYQGAVLRSVWPVERPGEGGLRSRRNRRDLATLVSRANDDFGQAEPARFAASAFAANGSPVYLYRFSYVQTAMRERMRAGTPHGGEIAFVFGTLGTGMLRAAASATYSRGSGGLSDGAKLLGQLRQDRRSEWCGLAGLAAFRSEQGFDL